MVNKIISKLLKAIKNVSGIKNILKNRTVISISAIFAANLVIFLITGILYFRNEVYIKDGDASYKVFTMSDDPGEILEEQGVELEEMDYYEFSGFDNETAYLDIYRAVTVSITKNGVSENAEIRSGGKVEDALKQTGIEINEFDVIKPGLSVVCGNGDSIEIIPPIIISITTDGGTVTLPVSAESKETVRDAIERAGIQLSAEDSVSPSPDAEIAGNVTEIVIERVKYTERVTINGIPYETIERESSLYPLGHTEVVTEGVNGSEKIVTREKLVNGKIVGSEFVSSEITNEPVDEVIVHGTALAAPYSKKEFDEIKLENGLPAEYEYIVSGKSCAYTARAGSGTASGRKLEIGTIAVDPSVIPYGSLLYIVTQDGKTVYGAAIAADTGYLTDVVADLYMGLTSENYADACNWGAKWVDIYVISVGKY